MLFTKSFHASVLIGLCCLGLHTMAMSSSLDETSANRYVAGNIREVYHSMIKDGVQHQTIGPDGVLRVYDEQKNVIDYRQLDPQQVSEIAAIQLFAWKSKGGEIPAAVIQLSTTPYPDGRTVTEKAALWQLDYIPLPVTATEVPAIFKRRQHKRQDCRYIGCSSYADCPPFCNGCLQPIGPSFPGVCVPFF
ncbi:hypothetical protein EJ08DRAFT_43320 [Tothia fuscella]|uniref:Uncharacterized protein n=1 Tax=Tothia fuscella TaxID=1048955 RepID=A0A9P4TTF3_9PEZI|nr:hypothetical protein EJ08DRAFT_43320 [Tothia fuscella]